MVSEFLSEECGRLKLNAQQHQENSSKPQEARVYLQPGKDREGYWTSENLIDQVKFNNSSNHAAFRANQ